MGLFDVRREDWRMDRYGLHGRIKAVPGKRDALAKHLLKAANLMKNVPGCELYILGVSPTGLDVVWVAEVWSAKKYHDSSLSVPAVRSLIRETLALIADFGQSVVTTPLGGKGLQEGAKN